MTVRTPAAINDDLDALELREQELIRELGQALHVHGLGECDSPE